MSPSTVNAPATVAAGVTGLPPHATSVARDSALPEPVNESDVSTVDPAGVHMDDNAVYVPVHDVGPDSAYPDCGTAVIVTVVAMLPTDTVPADWVTPPIW